MSAARARRRRARALASLCALAAAAGLASAGRARAATCAQPDLLDAVPADKAANVPPNASLFAQYEAQAEYVDESVTLTPDGGVAEAFAAGDPLHPDAVKWDGTQGLLTFTPPDRLPPGAYTLEWPALRGLNSAGRGRGALVQFTVGTADDVAAPTFAGLTGVTWDLERETNDCTNSLENRFVFTLALAPADDDGGRAALTLVVFESSGSGVDGGAVPVLTTPMPATDAPATVKLSVAEATGHVCFAAIARDLRGQISTSGSQTVCVDTIAPPFFRGCAVGEGAGRGGGAAACTLAFLGLVVLARQRHAR